MIPPSYAYQNEKSPSSSIFFLVQLTKEKGTKKRKLARPTKQKKKEKKKKTNKKEKEKKKKRKKNKNKTKKKKRKKEKKKTEKKKRQVVYRGSWVDGGA